MSNVFFTNRAAIPTMHSASGLFTTVIRYIMICLKYQANTSTVAKVSKISTAVTVTACSPRSPTATEPVAITYSIMDYVEAFAPIYCPIVVAVISIMVVFALLYVLYHSVLALLDGVTQASRWFVNTRLYTWIVRIAQWVSHTRLYVRIHYVVLWFAHSYLVVSIERLILAASLMTLKGYRYIQPTYISSAQENTKLVVEVSSNQDLPELIELTVKVALLEEVTDEAHIMEPIHTIAINKESTKLQKKQFQKEKLLIEYPQWAAAKEEHAATVSMEAAAIKMPKLATASLVLNYSQPLRNPFIKKRGCNKKLRLTPRSVQCVKEPKTAKDNVASTPKMCTEVIDALGKNSIYIGTERFEEEIKANIQKNKELIAMFSHYKANPKQNGNDVVELLNSWCNKMTELVTFFHEKMNTKWRPSSNTDLAQMEQCIDFYILHYYCENVQRTCKYLRKTPLGRVRDVLFILEKMESLLLKCNQFHMNINRLRSDVKCGHYSDNLVKAICQFSEMIFNCDVLLKELSKFEYYNIAEVMHRLDLENVQRQYYIYLCESHDAESNNEDVKRCLRELSYKYYVSETVEA